jgi:penicillin-binding protein 2
MDYRERWQLKEYLLERRLVRRMTLFHVVLILLLVAYLLTFWYLQVVRGAEYAHLAENNRLRRIPLPPTRGVIFDRRNEVIASTRPSLNLVLRRDMLQDADGQLRRLDRVLGVPYAELRDALDSMSGRPNFEPLVIKEDIGLGELSKIEARREWFPSVEVEQTARRDYPDRQAVAHAVGYVGEVGEAQLLSQAAEGTLELGDIVGKSGVERSYDDLLRGQRGWKLVTVNSLGRQLGEAQNGRAPEDGRQVRLTLDVRLQRALMEALGDEVGAGVFLDPWTGEVLALASSPAYDPNVFASHVTPAIWQSLVHDPRRPLQDRAVGSFYAPGSTFKVLMSVAGLESGAISPSTILHCGGAITMYGRPFLCWKKGGHGAVDVHRALVQSCNVFFYQVGRAAGIETIARYADMFNIGRPTGIDLPGEASGVLPSPEWKMRTRGEPWYAGETISVSIGQGILGATPVQLAVLMSGVATGQLPHPHLMRTDRPAEPRPLAVSAGTFAVVRSALQDVVEEGTGRRASLGLISVAGKTGTAQVYKKSAGIDADKLPKDERDHAWFAGYAPADRPEIAFAVIVEHGGHGGTTAAPIVKKVLEVFFADRLPPKPPSGDLRASLNRRAEATRVDAPVPR